MTAGRRWSGGRSTSRPTRKSRKTGALAVVPRYAMLCFARRCYTSRQQPRCRRTVLAQEAALIPTPLLFPLALAGRVYCTFDGHHPCVPVRTCVRVCACACVRVCVRVCERVCACVRVLLQGGHVAREADERDHQGDPSDYPPDYRVGMLCSLSPTAAAACNCTTTSRRCFGSCLPRCLLCSAGCQMPLMTRRRRRRRHATAICNRSVLLGIPIAVKCVRPVVTAACMHHTTTATAVVVVVVVVVVVTVIIVIM
eukprot:COSAG05_NODE_5122_length_1259_cov_0.992241_1_plen_254_part_00